MLGLGLVVVVAVVVVAAVVVVVVVGQLWDITVVWPHAIQNCVAVRIIHARYLSNSSITLTSKGRTRLFSCFRLVLNKIRPACVAPHVIETEKKNDTDYRLPGTD